MGALTATFGGIIRDVLALNASSRNFRVFGPDETASNRWGALFEVTDRCSTEEILATDEHVAHDGRVMEILSEHLCQGWLEGYLLTGRHGRFKLSPTHDDVACCCNPNATRLLPHYVSSMWMARSPEPPVNAQRGWGCPTTEFGAIIRWW